MNTGLKNERENELANDSSYLKKMKYYTANDFPELQMRNVHEGYGTASQEVENGTKLMRSTITNPRIRQDWGPLQTNFGGLQTFGPSIDHQDSRSKKSCAQNPGNDFYNRSFYLLDFNPNNVQKSSGYRQGVDTRNDSREEYK